MITSRRILLLALSVLPSVAGAQLVTGMGRAALTVTASLAVPVQMKVRPSGEPRVVRQEAAFTEYALDVSAASNVDWALSVALSESSPAGVLAQVRSEDGTWVDLVAADLTGRLVARGGPRNSVPFAINLRVLHGGGPGGSPVAPRALPRLRLLITPAEVAR